MKLDVSLPTPLALESFLEVNAERPNRTVLVQQPRLKVIHLTLAPGQALPPHKHPGCYVLLQGLSGTTTVQLEQDEVVLASRQLLGFSGEMQVSPRNDSAAPSALLITLVNDDERRNGENPASTAKPRVP